MLWLEKKLLKRNTWRLKSMLLNNQMITTKIKEMVNIYKQMVMKTQ